MNGWGGNPFDFCNTIWEIEQVGLSPSYSAPEWIVHIWNIFILWCWSLNITGSYLDCPNIVLLSLCPRLVTEIPAYPFKNIFTSSVKKLEHCLCDYCWIWPVYATGFKFSYTTAKIKWNNIEILMVISGVSPKWLETASFALSNWITEEWAVVWCLNICWLKRLKKLGSKYSTKQAETGSERL